MRLYATPCERIKYPQGDSNEPQNSREKQGFPPKRGTDSGTPTNPDTFDRLAAELMKLSPADRERLTALLTGIQGGAAEGKG
jgi:hypothetical protein